MSDIEVEQAQLIKDLREQVRELRRSRREIALDASGYEAELCSVRQQLAEFQATPEDPTWVLALNAKQTVANLRDQLSRMPDPPRDPTQDQQKAAV